MHGQLDFHLDFTAGVKYQRGTGVLCAVRDKKSKAWQHLNLFSILFHTRECRIKTPSRQGRWLVRPRHVRTLGSRYYLKPSRISNREQD